MYIRWEKAYETGQPLIDAEHRLLVMLFRKLDIGIKTHQPDATLTRIVLEVTKFVQFHFVSEENLMRETNYPGLEAHRKLHADLLVELKEMTSKLSAHREYPEDLLYFLNQWLIKHIADNDQLVARHARDASDRPVAELIYQEYLLSPSSGTVLDQ